MKLPLLFKEYIWLVETIYQARRITFAELNKRWKENGISAGNPLSRTSFNRHRSAILDMFGLIIECDRKDGYCYYIENPETLNENTVQNWMYSTLSVGNILDENIGIQHRILLESIPSGNDKLKQITTAMRENRCVSITYRKYGMTESNTFCAAPYCIKLFKRRWYVLVKKEKSGSENKNEHLFAIYSLDRVEKIKVIQTKFEMDEDFDAASYFNDSFGVMVAKNIKVARIVLRTYGKEQYYMRDLPLHHTQRALKATEEYTDFEIKIRPTADFKAHLLSRGEWIQVVEPAWLVAEMKELMYDTIKRYENTI